MNKQSNFDSLEQVMEHILGQIDDKERNLIINSSPEGAHLALARWVRDEFVYSDKLNVKQVVRDQILKNYTNELNTEIHVDNITGFIIDEIISRLNYSD